MKAGEYVVMEESIYTLQLESYGAASLLPVTSNSTDEGKAKNRRVEIVEQ